jgi:predicted RNA-binding Zn ribbon-like protein
MEALALDPGEYRGTYKLIGGRASLDFVNTVSWANTERSHDWLGSVDNVARWLSAVGLRPGDYRPADIKSIAALRTALTDVLRPLAHNKRPAREALHRLNERLSAANSRRIISPSTLAWTWKPSDERLAAFDPLLLDAAGLVTGANRDRLRHCPSCDWLFEDQTRNGQRRWCDMADCGSRDKAHRYYHRRK